MSHERIELHDTPFSAIAKLSEGNPCAVQVLMDIFQSNPKVDPDDVFGGLGPILGLDTLGVYGSKIWVLYKDCCGSDIVSLLTVMRAWQLGIIRQTEIRNAIEQNSPLDATSLMIEVQKILPKFGAV